MGVNYSSKILNNAVRALSVHQAVIATSGNNIANVNTPGYSRRVAELQTGLASNTSTSGLDVGTGVKIGAITRQVDEYLQRIVRQAQADAGSYGIQNDFLSRVESLFSLSDGASTIGSTLTKFFDSVNNLTLNPASIELRKDVIERATDLVDAIRTTYNSLASLQDEADDRLVNEVQSINGIISQIADLNGRITAATLSGAGGADEKDARAQLLEKLSEKISFSAVEDSTGSVTIMLANGFPLVNGADYRELSVTTTPSFGSSPYPPSLSGGLLNYIVYDYDQGAGSAHVDLTSMLAGGSGTVAGLLEIRGTNDASNTSAFDGDGVLVELASRVEAVTRQLLVQVNQTYLGPDRDSGTAGWQSSAGDLDGNNPAVFGLFDFAFGGTKDVDGDGYPELADLTDASIGIDSFSSVLQLAFSDPRRLAAAQDSSSGPPAAAVYAPGDGRNMSDLAALQTRDDLVFTVGSFSLTSSFSSVYNETVTHVGNAKVRADLNSTVAEKNLLTALNDRDQISAVNLDEEFTNLIKFQKSFEASARMIRTAGDMLDTIVSLI